MRVLKKSSAEPVSSGMQKAKKASLLMRCVAQADNRRWLRRFPCVRNGANTLLGSIKSSSAISGTEDAAVLSEVGGAVLSLYGEPRVLLSVMLSAMEEAGVISEGGAGIGGGNGGGTDGGRGAGNDASNGAGSFVAMVTPAAVGIGDGPSDRCPAVGGCHCDLPLSS